MKKRGSKGLFTYLTVVAIALGGIACTTTTKGVRSSYSSRADSTSRSSTTINPPQQSTLRALKSEGKVD